MKRLIFIVVTGWIISYGLYAQPVYDSLFNKIQNTYHNETWIKFALKMQKLQTGSQQPIHIIHLGDSHIQGGYFTNEVRYRLSQQYGASSRGWIFPYGLAHTNGPEDVSVQSAANWTAIKYNNNLPFTCISGYHLSTPDTIIKLLVVLKNESRIRYPFTSISLYHNSPFLLVSSAFSPQIINEKLTDNLYITRLVYKELHDSLQLEMRTHASNSFQFSLTGIELINTNAKLVYHAIGINGMAFSSYEKSIDYNHVLANLHPDCVVISLGTNDAYMQVNDTVRLKKQLYDLIENIRKTNGDCCIVLTTAGDHLRSKKSPNPSLIRVNKAIISAAYMKNCVYWDFFNVMGGLGSSITWKRNGYVFRDFVHLSKDGYKFQGKLFFEALHNAIMQTTNDGMDN